jgi:hypothetical protein
MMEDWLTCTTSLYSTCQSVYHHQGVWVHIYLQYMSISLPSSRCLSSHIYLQYMSISLSSSRCLSSHLSTVHVNQSSIIKVFEFTHLSTVHVNQSIIIKVFEFTSVYSTCQSVYHHQGVWVHICLQYMSISNSNTLMMVDWLTCTVDRCELKYLDDDRLIDMYCR